MSIEAWVLTKIAEEVFGYVAKTSKEKLSKTILGDPQQKAFERALGTVAERFQEEHPEWVDALFDASFMSREAAPVLAQFLVRDGYPDSSELAKTWADSLRLKGEKRTIQIRELEPVAAGFLSNLGKALKAEPDLRELQDSRALEQIASNTENIYNSLGTEKATPGTRYDYLRWLIDKNLYLDPRGISQTQRQVQLRLDEVYVSLRAQREETPGAVDKRLLEKELAELDFQLANMTVTSEEAEDKREQLVAFLQGRPRSTASNYTGDPVELAEVVSRHEQLVILGDPGSGKTTLLRYLALER